MIQIKNVFKDGKMSFRNERIFKTVFKEKIPKYN